MRGAFGNPRPNEGVSPPLRMHPQDTIPPLERFWVLRHSSTVLLHLRSVLRLHL